jgi:glucosamine-6-phosphate deaminase
MKSLVIDQLSLSIYPTVEAMGNEAARQVALDLNETVQTIGKARLLLATGTSQFQFLKALQKEIIPWDKITVFHLDEYVGLPAEHPASFRKYLETRILKFVKPKKVFYIQGDAPSIPAEIERYSDALSKHPIDVACVGIGENGHLAFNDPGVANFDDPQLVKRVLLDLECRQQQFHEGWFDSIETVPKEALTLTIPAIMNALRIRCVVPDLRKSKAVFQALKGPISENCPASILRRHPNAKLFLDSAAATQIEK